MLITDPSTRQFVLRGRCLAGSGELELEVLRLTADFQKEIRGLLQMLPSEQTKRITHIDVQVTLSIRLAGSVQPYADPSYGTRMPDG